MKQYFNKFKFTENLFFKSHNSSVEFGETSITILILPYFVYCGSYEIVDVLYNEAFGMTRYVTKFQLQRFYIDIHKGGNKISIFNDNKEGLILKR